MLENNAWKIGGFETKFDNLRFDKLILLSFDV
jgi:hypothetical protein